MSEKLVLAIETSCDDTSVAIVSDSGCVYKMLSAHQDDVHKPFGGVVPEIAGRNHSMAVLNLVDKVICGSDFEWKDISGLVVTSRPGLVGSLIVGLVTIKTLALAKELPFVGVNHIEGHIWAPFIYEPLQEPPKIPQKFLSLAVSGGHTQLVLVSQPNNYVVIGKTVDDAAGEAFDKFAKMMGLGYPGGVLVDKMAMAGDPHKFKFPRPKLKSNDFGFSFSGLKTSALNLLNSLSEQEKKAMQNDLCASFQEAIVDTLVGKLERAISHYGNLPISITGGVSANSRLRERVKEFCSQKKLELFLPDLKFCTDNAGMIGFAGSRLIREGILSSQNLGPSPRSLPNDFIYEDC